MEVQHPASWRVPDTHGTARRRTAMSRRILLGLTAGVAVGVLFGERAAVLEWPARAFVQLLQVTVLPYVVTSLVAGIATGTPSQARRLASKGGLVLLCLWGVSLALVLLAPLALPPEKGGSFYATQSLSEEPQIDWLDLYIPSNPFRSLANNIVPAVVVFSVLLGIALLGLPEKARILAPLRLINETLAQAGRLLLALTPIGIFAIAGHAAGTLRMEEFGRLQAFMLLWVGLSTILTLWILPGLVSVVTGVSFARILSLMWAPLITAFVTSNLFIVLPAIQERAKELLAGGPLGHREAADSVDVLVPTSFTFPHGAKLLSLSFVLFAGWFAGTPVPAADLPTLVGAGLLSLFGSLDAAVPFLLDLVRLPADLFQLFLVSGVVASHFGSAAAAMHTLALAMLGASFMAGGIRIDKMRLLTFVASTSIIVGGFLLASRMLLAAALPDPEGAAAMFDRLRVSGGWGRLAPIDTADEAAGSLEEPAPPAGERLDAILRRGTVRVCVSADAMPWCFVNGRDEIVGFEVDVAHAVAAQLDKRLSLVEVERVNKGAALARGTCDITIGRVVPSQAASMVFSRPITHEAWSFLAPDYKRNLFANLERIRELPSPRIAVFREREFMDRLKAFVPNAEVTPVDSIPEFLEAPSGRFDAMLTGLDRATAYSLMWPQFSAVVPTPNLGGVPIAIIVPKGEEALLDLVNAVVDVDLANGLFKEKLDYWVRGQGAQVERAPRWSLGANVFGWWED